MADEVRRLCRPSACAGRFELNLVHSRMPTDPFLPLDAACCLQGSPARVGGKRPHDDEEAPAPAPAGSAVTEVIEAEVAPRPARKRRFNLDDALPPAGAPGGAAAAGGVLGTSARTPEQR
jgi:hypothetical protein